MHIRCENIRKAYDGQPVLNGVDLEAKPGQVTVLIGPNGAGKTTLLRLLALLEKPDEGRIFFDDTPAHENPQKFRKDATMVFQQPVFLDRSVEANIAFGPRSRGVEDSRHIVQRVLETLGLQELRRKNARTLSGGQRKLVAVGMALAVRPRVLMLDECFANLDPISTKSLEGVLLSLKQNRQTVILATHSFFHAQTYGDFTYFLKDGTIAERGTADEMFARPSSLYAARYLGHRNVFRGTVESDGRETWLNIGGPAGRATGKLRIAVVTPLRGEVCAAIPPTDILVSTARLSSSALNSLQGTVANIALQGPLATITVDAGVAIEAVLTRRSLEELNLREGMEPWLTWKASAVHVFRDLDEG